MTRRELDLEIAITKHHISLYEKLGNPQLEEAKTRMQQLERNYKEKELAYLKEKLRRIPHWKNSLQPKIDQLKEELNK